MTEIENNETTIPAFRFIASCAAGIEKLVEGELVTFGGSLIKSTRGVVLWQGSLEAAYRACLWSRFSSRILLQLSEFEAKDENSLYENALLVNWSEHMDVDGTFAVGCNLAPRASIKHSKYASLKVKDAMADFFRDKYDRRPNVELVKPDVRINVHIDNDNHATLCIDLSGEAMHKRGYRSDGVIAPLKENLAAAIVALSGWSDDTEQNCLVDPMCGSGTLLIEAALIYGDSAPGLSRNYFGFTGWKKHVEELWSDLIDEAVEREEVGLERDWPVILGYDADPKAVSSARKNVAKAGLADKIRINQSPLSELQPPGESGLILCNPPYGERLAEKREVSQLYKGMGRIFTSRFTGWKVSMFISDPEMADSIGISWGERVKLFNGSIPCRLLISGDSSKQAVYKDFVWSVSDKDVDEGQDFANRLKKNAKTIFKRIKKENIQCFRIYDKDLPEYNISVDMYGKWVHVQEYAAPKTIDADLAKKRFNLALAVIRKVFSVSRERIFIKTRRRQKGKTQYEKQGEAKKMFTVREGEGFFLVNFTDYLDAGLFLDHRPVRMQIAKQAKGKRFLNLFGYTGSATVHAGLGGAASTTTVDLSSTYLDWAKMNLALNGLDGPSHKLIKADCVAWLKEDTAKYDLIFIDPPTFSNTKKDKRVFDVQQDHLSLVRQAMRLLDNEGLLIFSTNFRKFVLNDELSGQYFVKDVTQATIPFDFKRSHHIHKCWEIRHK